MISTQTKSHNPKTIILSLEIFSYLSRNLSNLRSSLMAFVGIVILASESS